MDTKAAFEKWPQQKLVRECFEYHRDGTFTWKVRPEHHFVSKRGMNIFNAKYTGRNVGSVVEDDPGLFYLHTSIGNRKLKVHRLVWIFHHGEIKDGMEIDHINHDGTDNRIENLRVVNSTDNKRNKTKQRNNTSGKNGVYWVKKVNKWRAIIYICGKGKHLGYFKDLDSAAKARLKAEIENNFHEGHGISSREPITSHGIRIKGKTE